MKNDTISELHLKKLNEILKYYRRAFQHGFATIDATILDILYRNIVEIKREFQGSFWEPEVQILSNQTTRILEVKRIYWFLAKQ